MKLEYIRKKGNKATHNVTDAEVSDELQIHKFLFEISIWYMQVYVTYNFEAPSYKLPINPATESNSLKVKDMDDLIKPYLDKKLDGMWVEIHRQLDDIRAEKERVQNEITNAAELEIAPTKEVMAPASKVYLQFKNEKIFIPSELADMQITDLPVNGCNDLLTELLRAGIDSLGKITQLMDQLHMRLNGIGISTMDKLWEQMNSIEGTVLANVRVNPNVEVKTIIISEEIQRVFTNLCY